MHRWNKGDSISRGGRLLRESMLGHLATCDTSLNPHVIPICFVYHNGAIYSSIDQKPKQRDPLHLRRVMNIKSNPKVCLIIDRYDEDWVKLEFVMIQGNAKLIWSGKEHRRAIKQLRRKYPQYKSMNLQSGPIIRIRPRRTTLWSAERAVETS